MEKLHEKPYKRRRYLVNKPVQLGILGFAFINSLFAVAAMYFHIDVATQFVRDPEFIQALGRDKAMSLVLETKGAAQSLMWVFAALFALLSLAFGVVFSHRIVGPINALERHMEYVAEGKDIGPLNVRKKDFFQKTIETYNRLLRSLDQ